MAGAYPPAVLHHLTLWVPSLERAAGPWGWLLGELGYRVTCMTFHDSPRRAHSIAAQGGILGWVSRSEHVLSALASL